MLKESKYIDLNNVTVTFPPLFLKKDLQSFALVLQIRNDDTESLFCDIGELSHPPSNFCTKKTESVTRGHSRAINSSCLSGRSAGSIFLHFQLIGKTLVEGGSLLVRESPYIT